MECFCHYLNYVGNDIVYFIALITTYSAILFIVQPHCCKNVCCGMEKVRCFICYIKQLQEKGIYVI